MSFSKNPPWLATSTAASPSLQAQIGLPNPMVNFQTAAGSAVFSQPQAPPPPNISLITQMAAAASVQQPPHTLYTQTVSYPAPRPMNTIAYPQPITHPHQLPIHPQMQQQQQQMSPQMPTMAIQSAVPCPQVVQSNIMATQRAYHGTVTKIQSDVGFIDDEIFFHKSVVCKGSMPKVGEGVFVEASYASNTPFKWNASRVQLLTPQGPVSKSGYNNSHSSSSSAPGENGNYSRSSNSSGNNRSTAPTSSHHRERSPRRSTDRDRSSASKRDSGRDSLDNDRRRSSRSGRDSERGEKRRDYSPPLSSSSTSDRRERSPATRSSRAVVSTSTRGSVSPPPLKKRRRTVPRYNVQIPKVSLKLAHVDVWEMKQRYNNLYVPSDFFHSEIRWGETFSADNPFVLRQPCAFQLMHKEIAPPEEVAADDSLLDPPDADNSFCAKVMLMSVPPMAEIYKQCFVAAENEEEGEEEETERSLVHPSRMVSFLVGQKGGRERETMAIGGAWSPSLDGRNPESDPTVLIRTAIRTCKALTGIDLSRCTQWYRFVELYYHRRESGRVQTVVIYMPDVRSCVPTAEEWLVLKGQYKMALQRALDQKHNSSKASNSNTESSSGSKAKAKATGKEAVKEKQKEPVAEEKKKKTAEKAEAEEAMQTTEADKEQPQAENGVDQKKEEELKQPADEKMEIAVDDKEADGANAKETVANDGEVKEIEEEKPEDEGEPPLDPKAMKMPELREALAARNLPVKGLKAELVERLTEALNSESAEKVAEAEDQDQPMIIEEIEKEEEEVAQKKETEEPTAPGTKEDESNQSMEEGEPDLANMTVIDEVCDPAKQPTAQPVSEAPHKKEGKEKDKSSHKEKDKEQAPVAKKLSEKDIRQLQRRYTLPEAPEIIVHPSKTARGGKFDCSVTTLSVLLDYGLEDSKEHSFEVYLFAELFNEMLMRDSAYNIYKALQGLPERKAEEEDQKEKSKEEKKDSKATKSTPDKRDRESKKDDGGGEKREKKERKKQITVNPELLLSFAYFDQTLCGYILCKDLEDLLSSIGLSLTKSQIRKVMRKGTVSDSLYYRKLTDKDKEEVTAAAEESDKMDTETSSSMAKGNLNLLPIFKSQAADKIVAKSSSSPSKPTKEKNETGLLVTFNGALVNVEKLMERIKTAERALLDTEQTLADVKKENAELTAANGKATAKVKDLSTDLKSVKKKLDEADSMAYSFQKKNSEYLSVMSSIQEKIAPILVKKERRETASRSEKEKEKKKDEEKEKEKDKETTKVDVKEEGKKTSGSSGSSKTTEEAIKKEK